MYLCSVAGDPFCEVVRWLENIHEELTGLLQWPADLSSSLEWPADFFLHYSPKLQSLYCLFKSHAEVWTSSLLHIFFCLWLVIRTYILLVFWFFLLICWSHLQMEISVTLSIGNKSYSSLSSFIFSTLLMLSCYCIESTKFIVAS